MTRIFTSILLSFLMSWCMAQTKLDIAGNATIQYTQNINGVKSDLAIVVQKNITDATPKISWSVKTGGQSHSKLYSYTARSVNDGNLLYLRIEPAFTPQNDANIILLSKKSFGEITIGKTAFKINGGAPSGFEVLGKEPFDITINGKPERVEAYHLKIVGDVPNQEIWVLNNPNNPIILKASGVYNLEATTVTQ